MEDYASILQNLGAIREQKDQLYREIKSLKAHLTAEQLAHEKTKAECGRYFRSLLGMTLDDTLDKLTYGEVANAFDKHKAQLDVATRRAEAAEKLADRLAVVMSRAFPTVQSRLTDYEEEYTAALQAHRSARSNPDVATGSSPPGI